MIRNLRVTNITTSSVILTWQEPVGKRSFFKLLWTGDKTIGNASEITSTSHHITNLTAGVNYTFCVTAVTADNLGESEPFCISKYTVPNMVRNLTVTNITTSSVFLTWQEPVGNRSFFKLHWSGDETIGNATEITNNSYNITNLTAGVNYTFCITAVAADHSTEGDTSCISQYIKPNVIRNLTVSEVTTSSVFLSWEELIGKRSFFKLHWTDDKMNGNVTETSKTSFNITDLIPGVKYTFCITAVAADNSTKGETFCTSKYTMPNMIRNLTVTNISTSSVILTWQEPVGNRSFFKLHWTGDKTIRNASEIINTYYDITDLTAGVNYTFCITAVAADHSTEGDTFCTSKYTKPNVIGNLIKSEVTTLSVFLSWNEPIGNRSFFKVKWTDNKNEKTKETSNTYHNITDLTAGVKYTFCITAVAADNSTEGDTFCTSKYTKPNVIGNLIKSEVTTLSVFLSWNEPIGNRSFFKVKWTDNKNEKTKETSNTSHNITDLTAGDNYTFCITAVAADHSTEGDAVCISQNAKPNMIRSLKASEVTTSSVFLTWDEPSGSRSFFRINLTEEKRMLKTTTNTSYHITDLTSGVNYTFCITAVAADSTEGDPFCISQYTKIVDAVPGLGVIVGSVVAVICFLLIITLIFFFYSRRQTQKKGPDIPVHNLRDKINLALRIEDYEEYFKRKHADSNCGFAEEYEELKSVGKAQSKDAAEAIENKAKNRYTNVLPYDASRVKLSMCGNPFDDYINANYVPGYNSRKEFIAAQGPLPVTVNEFWRMIWEKNVYTIVMLTKCNELGRVKCEKYWPSGTNHYHNISVTTTSEISLDSWTIRDFKIKNVKTAETRYVRQFHFTAWPDHGVPQTTEVLIDFRHLVREHMDQYSRHSPTVVHCSAGVGRTGTFIAIDHLIFQIERESMVDVYGIVNDMRMHRPLMVQTEEQYVYLHQCAYDIIRSRTGTNVDLIYQNTEAINSIYQNVKYIKS